MYKKDFPYELFTLITQGNATLESGSERLMSTVGPFSFFATSALLGNENDERNPIEKQNFSNSFCFSSAENKTVKDVQDFLDHLAANAEKTQHNMHLLDEISPIFVPDYNLIVNSEIHILQIHRLVWLSAVQATQRQRSNDQNEKRKTPEDLFSNALDEIVRRRFSFCFLRSIRKRQTLRFFL